ncbi:MAG: hypothetical protein J5985_03320 [Kiritimatiellae bacterium]|nr:hypothetical protein [Kiritimatiellia bacterium]
MDKNTDQTKFWLAWRATCAAIDCTDSVVLESKCKENPEAYKDVLSDIPGTTELALEMIRSTNSKFENAVKYFSNLYGKRRNSDYADEVAGWQDGDPKRGCAFAILESKLYASESIKGHPFKDYLFETIGNRDRGLSGNICGYINSMLRTIARDSFSKTECIEERVDDEGRVLETQDASTDSRSDFSSLPPCQKVEIDEVVEFFGQYVDELGSPCGDKPSAWDKDNWISVYCALHEIPINNPEVRALCRHGKSMLAEIRNKTVANLLSALRERASDRAIAWAIMTGAVQSLLAGKMKDMPFYPDLERVRESLQKKRFGEAENHRV